MTGAMSNKRLAISAFILSFVCFSQMSFAQADSLESKDPYRHFIMPTAKPLNGGYAGVWELAFVQAGYGFGNFLTFSGGITLMPTVSMKSQFGFLQAKATLADEEGISFAVGVNYLRLTSTYPYIHVFAVATAEQEDETRYTGVIFLKAYGDDYPVVDIYPYGQFSFAYGGSLGAGIGFDKPIKGLKNTRIIAEIWNHDLSVPTKIAFMLGLRVETHEFSSDFGLMYFTVPLLAPVANFVYRF
jgi:hypothetical protein